MERFAGDRREFLKKAVVAASALPLLAACGGDAAAQRTGSILDEIKRNAMPDPNNGRQGGWHGAVHTPADVSWRTVLSEERDKGEPIEINGVVYQADGKTPAPNTLIYLYHTDFEGYYGRAGAAHGHGKYRGWMLTDKDGKYSFRTIKPAPYPENRFAAHIHMTVTTAKAKEDWVDSILFEGDRLISPQEREQAGRRGGFNPVLTFEKGPGGISRATRNIQLLS
jgi:protocatechuate 3,4-dioxygenase, beta subunit